jgi:site-specific recombinase XerC
MKSLEGGEAALIAPPGDLFDACVRDFLAGLQAAKRSAHTIDAYRSDLLAIAALIATQRHGPDATLCQLRVDELDGRAMRHAFATFAADHAAASIIRAWASATASVATWSTTRRCSETR